MAELTGIESKLFTAVISGWKTGNPCPSWSSPTKPTARLSPARDNAILVVHGYTSSHHAAGRNAPGKQGRGVAEGAAGWFDGLIGPGKAVDTDRSFVVSVNALGSAHGSTGPNCTDPRTGKPYGPTFPDITMRDIVAAREAAGRFARAQEPGGGDRPVDGRLPVVPVGGVLSRLHEGDRAVGDGAALAGRAGPAGSAAEAPGRAIPTGTAAGITTMAASPGTLEEIRFETLMAYGQNEILAETMPDPKAREAAIRANARAWAQIYDGHSMVVAAQGDRHVRHHGRIRQAQEAPRSSTSSRRPTSCSTSRSAPAT